MSTLERINFIIQDQYEGYKGRIYSRLKIIHDRIREVDGDENFLQFLEKQMRENPAPKYTPSITI